LGKLGILKNKLSLGWSGFGSIIRKEQGKIRRIGRAKKKQNRRETDERIGKIGNPKKKK
jgi:hypothetical protein